MQIEFGMIAVEQIVDRIIFDDGKTFAEQRTQPVDEWFALARNDDIGERQVRCRKG